MQHFGKPAWLIFEGGLRWGWSGFALFYLSKKKKILRFRNFFFIPLDIYSLMQLINLVLFYSKCLKSKVLLTVSAPRPLQELSTTPRAVWEGWEQRAHAGPCQHVSLPVPPRWEPGRLRCGTVLLRNDSSEPLRGEEEERKEEAQDVGFVLMRLYSLAHTQESQY